MERRRLQQQRMKQQQRFCVSQQDLTQAIARMKPHRRATHDNLSHLSSSSSLSTCSVETLTIPSVTQLIKEFEARTISTPYVSAQDFVPNNHVVVLVSNGASSHSFQSMSDRTMNIKVNEQSPGDQTTLDNERNKREHPSSSSPPSSYHSAESNNNNPTVDMSQRNERFNEIRAKEVQLNNALADLISMSNDADISSSISSSSRSLLNNSQRRRASSTNETANSISASIALLNNLLETFDLDLETSTKENPNKNETVEPINMFW